MIDKPRPMPERLFSTYQVADLLGATAADVVEWMEKGWLKFRRMPNGPIRIPESGLIQFLKDRGVDMEAIMAKVVLGPPHEDEDHSEQPLRQALPPAAEAKPPSLPAADTQAAPPADHWRPAEVQAEPPRPAEDAPSGDGAAQVVQAVLRDAVARGASHVHFEPRPDGLALRLRIDGVLHEKANFKARLPRNIAPRIAQKLAELAGMEGQTQAAPGAGSFTASVDGREIRFGLSMLPTQNGMKAVLRVFDRRRDLPDLESLELIGPARGQVARLLEAAGGLIVLACPPRVGAEPLLWAMANRLNTSGRSVVSLQRRIDYEVPMLNQVLLGSAGGARAQELIAALAEQDADAAVIEALDGEAELAAALEFAQTGRLALAGLDAPDALAAAMELARLRPACGWPLRRGLLAVMAGRTFRKLCQECKKPSSASPEALEALGLQAGQLAGEVHGPQGCGRCGGSGYFGRAMLVEVIGIDGRAASALSSGDTAALEAAAGGFRSFRELGLQQVQAGATSLDELARALPARGDWP